jgi:diaminohydroxyphosphoribosylaminopyrimidine deaminase/5-amino-6-(5-phosphoribosylamino)uracil reductase
VLADDPLLNTRLDKPETKDPVRVVLDGNLELPVTSRIAATAAEIETIVYTAEQVDEAKKTGLEAKGITVVRVDGSPDRLDLSSVMRDLAARQITGVLLEGGGEVNAAMLQEGLVDKVYWFVAPKLIGGRTAPGPVGGTGVDSIKAAWQLKDIEVDRCGQDILITGYL